jgi:hypothetical protein
MVLRPITPNHELAEVSDLSQGSLSCANCHLPAPLKLHRPYLKNNVATKCNQMGNNMRSKVVGFPIKFMPFFPRIDGFRVWTARGVFSRPAARGMLRP